jgi:membrane-associated phospholipid phosphatase
MARALVVTAAALAACTALVLTGALTAIDNWAIDHVMPGLVPRSHGGIVSAAGLWRPFPLNVAWWHKLLDVYLYPASFLVSAVIVTAACALLLRRGSAVAALLWMTAWLGANAAELVGKVGIERPDVHWSNDPHPIHILSFDHSYPSGHSARAVVLAALLAYVFPRLRFAAAAWLVVVPALLVVVGDHTVSDVVGGTLLGLLFVLAVHAMMREWIRSKTSSSASSGASSGTPTPSSPTSPATRSASATPS